MVCRRHSDCGADFQCRDGNCFAQHGRGPREPNLSREYRSQDNSHRDDMSSYSGEPFDSAKKERTAASGSSVSGGIQNGEPWNLPGRALGRGERRGGRVRGQQRRGRGRRRGHRNRRGRGRRRRRKNSRKRGLRRGRAGDPNLDNRKRGNPLYDSI